jgi:hypothetical protein
VELKNVTVVQSNLYKEGSTMKFNLMVRNKNNIIVKDKQGIKGDEEAKHQRTKLPTTKFPI